MTTEETELTFIRCPSCRSLVPAVATRCRMCGHVFESDSDESENSESIRKKSRVRQRTMSVSRDEIGELTQGASESWHSTDAAEEEFSPPDEAEAFPIRDQFAQEQDLTKPVSLAELLDAEQLEAYAGHSREFESEGIPETERYSETESFEDSESFGGSGQYELPQAFAPSSSQLEDTFDYSAVAPEAPYAPSEEAEPSAEDPLGLQFSNSFADEGDHTAFLASAEETAPRADVQQQQTENAPLRFGGDAVVVEASAPPSETFATGAEEDTFSESTDFHDSESGVEFESGDDGPEEDGGDVEDGEQPSRRKRRRRRRKRPAAETRDDAVEASENLSVNQTLDTRGESTREHSMPIQETAADARVIGQGQANHERRIQEVPRGNHGKPVHAQQDGTLVGWFVTFARDGQGVSTEVRSGRYFLGREKLRDQDMVIGDTAVSTPHCLISAAPGDGIRVQDLMSDQGTFIKKRGKDSFVKIEDSVSVEHGDSLRFGAYEVLVCLVP